MPLADYDLVLADPPYSVEDAERYQTTMVQRNVVMRSLAAGMRPGARVVWLDQVLPMYRKDEWAVEAVIGMVKSTNHRFRHALFRRLDRPSECEVARRTPKRTLLDFGSHWPASGRATDRRNCRVNLRREGPTAAVQGRRRRRFLISPAVSLSPVSGSIV